MRFARNPALNPAFPANSDRPQPTFSIPDQELEPFFTVDEFYRSDFSRADPPQVEFVGIRLEVSTDNDGVLHYRVLEAPTLGSTIEQPFPALVPARPR